MKKSYPRMYLSTPHMGGNELKYIHEAFDSNWIAPLGANVDEFEHDLERYIGGTNAAVLASGTAALHLALILSGVTAGDEVICQSFTFTASANPIKYLGAHPVFIDSEPETWNMDPVLLEQAIIDRIDKKPKAIVVVHLYGMPAKMRAINKIADKYKIPVIEDAAEALGSSLEGRKCGSYGMFSILSFNGNKIITTSGGGALLSADKNLIGKARFLATQARDNAPHYQHSELGYNYRMSNIVAGIGRGQMEVLDDRLKKRRANHEYYKQALNGKWLEWSHFDTLNQFDNSKGRGAGIYFLKEPAGYFSNRWLTTIIVNPMETDGITKDHIRLALEEVNIETRPLWKPMHQQPLYSNYPSYTNGVSDQLFDLGLCLPSGSNLTDTERARVVNSIKDCLSEVKSEPAVSNFRISHDAERAKFHP